MLIKGFADFTCQRAKRRHLAQGKADSFIAKLQPHSDNNIQVRTKFVRSIKVGLIIDMRAVHGALWSSVSI